MLRRILTKRFGKDLLAKIKKDRTYGSLGAVIALLMWLFVTGLVLLFGAEVDAVTKQASSAKEGGAKESAIGAHGRPLPA